MKKQDIYSKMLTLAVVAGTVLTMAGCSTTQVNEGPTREEALMLADNVGKSKNGNSNVQCSVINGKAYYSINSEWVDEKGRKNKMYYQENAVGGTSVYMDTDNWRQLLVVPQKEGEDVVGVRQGMKAAPFNGSGIYNPKTNER